MDLVLLVCFPILFDNLSQLNLTTRGTIGVWCCSENVLTEFGYSANIPFAPFRADSQTRLKSDESLHGLIKIWRGICVLTPLNIQLDAVPQREATTKQRMELQKDVDALKVSLKTQVRVWLFRVKDYIYFLASYRKKLAQTSHNFPSLLVLSRYSWLFSFYWRIIFPCKQLSLTEVESQKKQQFEIIHELQKDSMRLRQELHQLRCLTLMKAEQKGREHRELLRAKVIKQKHKNKGDLKTTGNLTPFVCLSYILNASKDL